MFTEGDRTARCLSLGVENAPEGIDFGVLNAPEEPCIVDACLELRASERKAPMELFWSEPCACAHTPRASKSHRPCLFFPHQTKAMRQFYEPAHSTPAGSLRNSLRRQSSTASPPLSVGRLLSRHALWPPLRNPNFSTIGILACQGRGKKK